MNTSKLGKLRFFDRIKELFMAVIVKLAGLKQLSKNRIKEARALLRAHHYQGAQYLCGYAVEHALKFQICKNLGWKTYPPKNDTTETFGNNLKSFSTHDPKTLLLISGKQKEVYNDGAASSAWDTIKGWDSEMRYEISPKGKMDLRRETLTMIESAVKLLNFLDIKI